MLYAQAAVSDRVRNIQNIFIRLPIFGGGAKGGPCILDIIGSFQTRSVLHKAVDQARMLLCLNFTPAEGPSALQMICIV